MVLNFDFLKSCFPQVYNKFKEYEKKNSYTFIFLEFVINSREALQKFVETHQFHVILSYFRQIKKQLLVQFHLLVHHLHHLLEYAYYS